MPGAHGEGGLRGYNRFVAFSGQRLAKDDFRIPEGVDIGRIEEIDARFEADVDQATGLRDIGLPPSFKEFVASTKRCRAEAQGRNPQARTSELPYFHGATPLLPGKFPDSPFVGASGTGIVEVLCRPVRGSQATYPIPQGERCNQPLAVFSCREMARERRAVTKQSATSMSAAGSMRGEAMTTSCRRI